MSSSDPTKFLSEGSENTGMFLSRRLLRTRFSIFNGGTRRHCDEQNSAHFTFLLEFKLPLSIRCYQLPHVRTKRQNEIL